MKKQKQILFMTEMRILLEVISEREFFQVLTGQILWAKTWRQNSPLQQKTFQDLNK
jgi:hypothetical protein